MEKEKEVKEEEVRARYILNPVIAKLINVYRADERGNSPTSRAPLGPRPNKSRTKGAFEMDVKSRTSAWAAVNHGTRRRVSARWSSRNERETGARPRTTFRDDDDGSENTMLHNPRVL